MGEKKFAGKHVVFVAQRRILAKPTRKANKLNQSVQDQEPLLPFMKKSLTTWSILQKLLAREFESDWTDQDYSKSIWIKINKLMWNIRQIHSQQYTRSLQERK